MDTVPNTAVFALIAKHLALAKGNPAQAAMLAQATGAGSRVVDILKAAVGAAGPDDAAWAGSTVGYRIAVGGFMDLLRSRSVFFRLLRDGALVRVPLRTRLGVITADATGWVVGAGAAVPVSRMGLAAPTLDPVKAAAIAVLTDEMVASPGSEGLITRALRGAVADAVDGQFLAMIVDGASPSSTPSAASSGNTAAAALADLRGLLAVVNTTGNGALYWVASPDVANRAATLAGDGGLTFPGMTALGGEMLGLPALVSNQVDEGSLFLIDASGIAGDSETITLDASSDTTVEMLDESLQQNALTGAGTTMVSMFETNSVAFKAVAWFGAERFRDGAVAILTDIAWGDAT